MPPWFRRCIAWSTPIISTITTDSDGSLDEFTSMHTGGVNFLFADGSVHFLRDNLTPAVLNALASRAGGEPVSNWE